MAEGVTIEEGFICPICHKDLRSPDGLMKHFQELHSEEQDILKSLKEFYGKAKKKILKIEEPEVETFREQIVSDNKYYLDYSEIQEPGQTRSHINEFKAARRDRLDHRTTETNKLIIRLDRLLRCDKSDRKQQEQELVAWLDGSTVTRCPSCAASFNITRRQHHCRLCGSIMCNSCSYFLSYETAQAIVAPVHNVDLNSTKEAVNKENDSIRICSHCLAMLETRRRAQIAQMMQPVICQLYNHLQKLKSQTQTSVELYLKMYNSLTAGEPTFHLQDAQALRGTIAKKAEAIDVLSKKIAGLPVDPDTPRVGELQNNIRKAASYYIKNYLLTLPAPPTVQELAAIKQQRSLRYSEDDLQPQAKVNLKKITVTTGWSPDMSNEKVAEDEDDPIMLQINIVRGYIAQARKAQRFEEVASLEENLKLLKQIYQEEKKKKEKQSTESVSSSLQ